MAGTNLYYLSRYASTIAVEWEKILIQQIFMQGTPYYNIHLLSFLNLLLTFLLGIKLLLIFFLILKSFLTTFQAKLIQLYFLLYFTYFPSFNFLTGTSSTLVQTSYFFQIIQKDELKYLSIAFYLFLIQCMSVCCCRQLAAFNLSMTSCLGTSLQ